MVDSKNQESDEQERIISSATNEHTRTRNQQTKMVQANDVVNVLTYIVSFPTGGFSCNNGWGSKVGAGKT